MKPTSAKNKGTCRGGANNNKGRVEKITKDELSHLLQDRTFVDYFNVFLSLPVFSQKAIYIYGDKDFEFDPPLTRTKYNLDRSRLIKWVLEERAPLFLKSELYVEYLFCKELVATRLFFSSSSRQLEYGEFCHREDTMILEEAIGHVVGMARFRKYLEGSPGEQVYNFWMDAERLKRIPKWDSESRWIHFREMQLKYFKADALASVKNSEAWEVFSDGSSLYGDQPFKPVDTPTGRTPDCLPSSMSSSALEHFISMTLDGPKEAKINDAPVSELQGVVLAVIKDYWLQKYLLHSRSIQIKQLKLSEVDDKGIPLRSKTDLAVLRDVKNIDKALTLLQGVSESSKQKIKKKKGRISWNAMFPENKVDDTYLIPSDEVITLHDDGSVSMELAQSEEFEKMLQKYLATSSDEEPQESEKASSSASKTSGSTSSSRRSSAASSTPGSASKRPPRRQSIDLMKRIALAEARKQTPQTPESAKTKLDLFEQLLNLHMSEVVTEAPERPQSCPAKPQVGDKIKEIASKKKMAGSGSGKMTKPDRHSLKKQIIEEEAKNLPTISENEALVSSAPASISTYSRQHPGTIITKLDHKYKNLCEGYYRHDHASYVLSIAADRLGGTPFQNFLFQRKYHAFNWQIMNFWHTIQIYLATKFNQGRHVGDYLRYRRAKAMLMRYLSSVGDRHVQCLPPGLNKLLHQVVPEGGGDELLRDAQDLICEYLRKIWKKYLKYDRNLFLETVLVKKKQRGSISRELPRVGSVPPYFEKQSRLPSLFPSDSSDKVANEESTSGGDSTNAAEKDAPETVTGALSERRATRALQLTVDIADFYDDGLPLEEFALDSIKFDIDNPYGSLDVPSPVVVTRPDLEEELQRQRRLARMKAARLAALEEEELSASKRVQIVVEDETPSYMKPFKKGGTLYHRPPRPSRFGEVMTKDPIHMEFFRRYLVYKGADTPFQFCQAVEDLKKTKEPKVRQQKINQMIRKYFKSNGTDALECDADVIKEIPKMEKVTTAMLISAQACVQRSLEDNRFRAYLDTFPLTEVKSNVLDTVRLFTENGKREWGKKRTRSLWIGFINTVVVFRRGILNQNTADLFEDFLKAECKKEIEKQRSSGQNWSYGMPVKKVIKGRLIDVTKLVCDLRFLAEAERYRSMCDDATVAAKEGNYSVLDQSTLERKAKMIIDCFIESDLPPKLQINSAQDVAETIVEMFNNNMIERGLFHYATVSIFPTMVYFWKKFQKDNIMSVLVKLQARKSFNVINANDDKSSLSPDYFNLTNLKTKRIFAHHAEDDHPRIMFSLLLGPRLLIPCSREQSRRATVFQIGRNSVFYANMDGHDPPSVSPSFLNSLSPSQAAMQPRRSSVIHGARVSIDEQLSHLRKTSKLLGVKGRDKLGRPGSMGRKRTSVQFQIGSEDDDHDGGRKSRKDSLWSEPKASESRRGSRQQSEHVVLPPITLNIPEY